MKEQKPVPMLNLRDYTLLQSRFSCMHNSNGSMATCIDITANLKLNCF